MDSSRFTPNFHNGPQQRPHWPQIYRAGVAFTCAMQPRLSPHCPLRVDCEATTPKISNLTLMRRSEALWRTGDGASQKQHLRLRLEGPRLRA